MDGGGQVRAGGSRGARRRVLDVCGLGFRSFACRNGPARCRERREWRAVLHRRIAELAHGFDPGDQPGRWPAVDGRRPKAHAQAAGLIAAEAKFVSRSLACDKITAPRAAGDGCGMPSVEEGLSEARRFRPRLAWRRSAARDELAAATWASTIVQIDDPHLGLFVDPDVRSSTTIPTAPPSSRSTRSTRWRGPICRRSPC